jgi:hypothetical protein
VCVVYDLAHPAVAPPVVDEGYNAPSFSFDTAVGGDDLVGEVTEV